MTGTKSDNIVEFKPGAPSARVKTWHEVGDKRSGCRHEHVEIYAKEPILECADCGGIVDPYYWIRQRCDNWKRMEDAVKMKVGIVTDELNGLKDAVRKLRGEWKDETEKRRTFSIMPPRKSF